jgi:hypothetical protein
MTPKAIRRCILKGALSEHPAWFVSRYIERQYLWNAEVPYRPAKWLERPLTPVERVQFCRELERMARDGLIQRFTWMGTRTSGVQVLALPLWMRPRRRKAASS